MVGRALKFSFNFSSNVSKIYQLILCPFMPFVPYIWLSLKVFYYLFLK